ncbi:hypothetical protein GWK08_11110 [Leptobacterium flavescens]|uniref:Alpha-L-glutamate ligase-related protein ATP-grasp domain-containing protein n=1 Tax=Leptobacterium flavescens TaxID=472055 RepID=A0A6P0UNA9_9FLAO|nr:sugar-transfer associated ATP-grasp domain-containing protein [Leptobacterium flavescens]NER13992.1 hypothetical protein [Leptobacterium flavescens]
MNISASNPIYRKVYRQLFILKKNLDYRSEVKGKLKTVNGDSLSDSEINEIKQYYASFGFSNVKNYWHKFYKTINGTFFKEYIPEDLFYSTIEPCLNRKELLPALSDKNLLGKVFDGVKMPATVVQNINGFYTKDGRVISKEEAISLCSEHSRLIFKPSIHSGGGVGVVVCSINNGMTDFKNKSLEELLSSYRRDFIVQEVVKQNKVIASLNPSSLNTLRVVSYLREEEVVVLSTAVRIGGKGQFTDNVAISGVACGLNEDGSLKDLGYNKMYQPFEKGEDGIVFSTVKIPFYDKVKETVKKLHAQIPYFRLVSWDIALDDSDEVVLIEYNVMAQGIFTHQLITGPMFGKYTDEILSFSAKYQKNL